MREGNVLQLPYRIKRLHKTIKWGYFVDHSAYRRVGNC